ncbi:hypothetical protein VP01_9g4 [Puccinia sorghi]|uniref:Uncharacterized protein n=1 Tax=Puccinia sorghi TaxID=27349 RepID=A0A0L6U542_9BASI|nr:hypothetical protein VP01_9g4 [Puccinia sorghi]
MLSLNGSLAGACCMSTAGSLASFFANVIFRNRITFEERCSYKLRPKLYEYFLNIFCFYFDIFRRKNDYWLLLKLENLVLWLTYFYNYTKLPNCIKYDQIYHYVIGRFYKIHPFQNLFKLAQLIAVDMRHAPAKLPSKLHLFSCVDVLAQSLCSLNSDCESNLGGITLGECEKYSNTCLLLEPHLADFFEPSHYHPIVLLNMARLINKYHPSNQCNLSPFLPPCQIPFQNMPGDMYLNCVLFWQFYQNHYLTGILCRKLYVYTPDGCALIHPCPGTTETCSVGFDQCLAGLIHDPLIDHLPRAEGAICALRPVGMSGGGNGYFCLREVCLTTGLFPWHLRASAVTSYIASQVELRMKFVKYTSSIPLIVACYKRTGYYPATSFLIMDVNPQKGYLDFNTGLPNQLIKVIEGGVLL